MYFANLCPALNRRKGDVKNTGFKMEKYEVLLIYMSRIRKEN